MAVSRLNIDVELPLLVILGPTASGKTRLAAQIASIIDGEIISADSRQVYRGMTIGTGKDLDEYVVDGKQIHYHLIDIVDAGEKYNVHRFQQDFDVAYNAICGQGRVPVVCGGSGMYLDAVLKGHSFTSVPVDLDFRAKLENMDTSDLVMIFYAYNTAYKDRADVSTRKRLIRAIEISEFLTQNPGEEEILEKSSSRYPNICFGLNPALEVRRERISSRLKYRLENGLIEEVEHLLKNGLSAEQVVYYGLEYKYVTQYLMGQMALKVMTDRLEAEIHRFAKRQMTFFRKMERDNTAIDWLDPAMTTAEQAAYIISKYNVFRDAQSNPENFS